MALETLSSNELLNYIIYDTISATPFTTSETTFFHLHNQNPNPNSSLATTSAAVKMSPAAAQPYCSDERPEKINSCNRKLGVEGGVGRKKKRRRPSVCKNKEEAETQRMTHIAVERNRRKQMNEHLAVLKSLMPESYVQRGDQASIVGGAIEFVKELEYLLQSLEAQKFLTQQNQQEKGVISHDHNSNFATTTTNLKMLSNHPPFSQFFSYPQYTCSQIPNKYTSKSKGTNADIEVTLIETHANLRILLRKRLTQLSKIVASFQTLLHLSILHLNVTTLDPLVLYSISVKVEEGCQLNSADDIATAVHKMLIIIEEEDTLCVGSIN